MTDRAEIGDVEERNNYSSLNEAFKETLSERIAALQIAARGASEEPATLDFNTKDIYKMPGDKTLNGDTACSDVPIDRTTMNTQSSELNEGFSSRMNREDDRQPYLDAQRHQQDASGFPANEQSINSAERLKAFSFRIDNPQPVFE